MGGKQVGNLAVVRRLALNRHREDAGGRIKTGARVLLIIATNLTVL
jgi:hypothetical protein